MRYYQLQIAALAILSLVGSINTLAGAANQHVPIGVTFHTDTLYRSNGNGDNWCITWAKDDSQVTSMDDGNWLTGKNGYHNHLYRIVGGPDNFSREDIPNYPEFKGKTGSWFGYGIVSVDGVLYSVVSKTPGNSWSGPFPGYQIAKVQR